MQHEIFAHDNSVASVASAINSQYGDQVRAVVVNVGSAGTPDYRLSLQATQLGNLAPDLLDGGSSLQTQHATGTLARYIVNGSGNIVTSSSHSVTIAQGVTVTLAAASADPVNITVTRSTSALVARWMRSLPPTTPRSTKSTSSMGPVRGHLPDSRWSRDFPAR